MYIHNINGHQIWPQIRALQPQTPGARALPRITKTLEFVTFQRFRVPATPPGPGHFSGHVRGVVWRPLLGAVFGVLRPPSGGHGGSSWGLRRPCGVHPGDPEGRPNDEVQRGDQMTNNQVPRLRVFLNVRVLVRGGVSC